MKLYVFYRKTELDYRYHAPGLGSGRQPNNNAILFRDGIA